MKNILALLLAVLSILSVFSLTACTSESTPKDTDAQSSQGETDGMETEAIGIENLPKIDYDGYTFVMNYQDQEEKISDMSFDESASDVLEVAKYQRAMNVMEYYGITLEPMVISGDNAGIKAIDSIIAGDNDIDLVMPHAQFAWGHYITPGYALEWTKNMVHNDLDAVWWDQGAKECLSIGDKLYTMVGDNSWMLLGYTVGIVFNKQILDNHNIEYPYDDVRNESWTFDKFYQIASQTKSDLNGDTAIEFGTDRMGYETTIYGGTIGFLWTTGRRVVEKDEDDIPYIAFNNEKVADLYDRFFSMMNEVGFKIMTDTAFYDISCEHFIADEVVMIDTYIKNLEYMRDKQDFGVVPYPMFDESVGDYYSTADAGVHSIIVPYNAPNVERTSLILEALTVEGYKQVIPAFYETTLKTKYTDDDADKDMLDVIRDSRTFDLAYYTGQLGAFSLPGYYLTTSNQKFSSFYQAHASSAESKLEDLVELIVYDLESFS